MWEERYARVGGFLIMCGPVHNICTNRSPDKLTASVRRTVVVIGSVADVCSAVVPRSGAATVVSVEAVWGECVCCVSEVVSHVHTTVVTPALLPALPVFSVPHDTVWCACCEYVRAVSGTGLTPVPVSAVDSCIDVSIV